MRPDCAAVITVEGDYGYSTRTKANPQELKLLGVLVCLAADWAVWVVLRLCVVQPLAQVVADYAGHNGNNKGDYIFRETPPSRRKEAQHWR